MRCRKSPRGGSVAGQFDMVYQAESRMSMNEVSSYLNIDVCEIDLRELYSLRGHQ